MQISNETAAGGTIVRFVGSLDTGTAAQAQSHMTGLIGSVEGVVIADLGGVDYISSAGLRVLLATGKKLRRSGSELRICALNEMAEEVFEISGFSTLFKIFDTAEAALAA
ncbi:MAG: STAS domain-containing protein [Myxococcales bacterium]|nr:STAS domain-containing protein [Myxococcales bacterium]